MADGLCKIFASEYCSKYADFYSKVNDESLLHSLAYWKALNSACEIKISSDQTFNLKAYNESLKQALASGDYVAAIAMQHEFSRHHKSPLSFGRLCVHEQEHIAREIKSRLGLKEFNHPMIKLLRSDPTWRDEYLTTPVMQGPGKQKVWLKKKLGAWSGTNHHYYEDLEQEALTAGLQAHRKYQKAVKSWMKMADQPIADIIEDKETCITFLETGELTSTNRAIVNLPREVGVTLKNNVLWNLEQLRYLAYLKVLLETLLPILLEERKHGLPQISYEKVRYIAKKIWAKEKRLTVLLEEVENEDGYKKVKENTKVTKKFIEMYREEEELADTKDRISRVLERVINTKGRQAFELYRQGYTRKKASKMAGITDKTFRNNIARLKKVVSSSN